MAYLAILGAALVDAKAQLITQIEQVVQVAATVEISGSRSPAAAVRSLFSFYNGKFSIALVEPHVRAGKGRKLLFAAHAVADHVEVAVIVQIDNSRGQMERSQVIGEHSPHVIAVVKEHNCTQDGEYQDQG